MNRGLHRREVVASLLKDRKTLLVVAGLGSTAWDITAAASGTDFRIRDGMADLVSRRDAISTASLPKTSIAAPTAASAPYSSLVVTISWATSACICSSVAPYSALPKPPKRAVPSSMVISLLRRSPWEIWQSCSVPSDSHTRATAPSSAGANRSASGGSCGDVGDVAHGGTHVARRRPDEAIVADLLEDVRRPANRT